MKTIHLGVESYFYDKIRIYIEHKCITKRKIM